MHRCIHTRRLRRPAGRGHPRRRQGESQRDPRSRRAGRLRQSRSPSGKHDHRPVALPGGPGRRAGQLLRPRAEEPRGRRGENGRVHRGACPARRTAGRCLRQARAVADRQGGTRRAQRNSRNASSQRCRRPPDPRCLPLRAGFPVGGRLPAPHGRHPGRRQDRRGPAQAARPEGRRSVCRVQGGRGSPETGGQAEGSHRRVRKNLRPDAVRALPLRGGQAGP